MPLVKGIFDSRRGGPILDYELFWTVSKYVKLCTVKDSFFGGTCGGITALPFVYCLPKGVIGCFVVTS